MADRALFIVLFTGVWCLVGVIFLGVGLGLRRSALRREERQRARAEGTVVEVVRRQSGDSVGFCPIVAFTADGRRVSLECPDAGGRKRHWEGQTVEVLYDPDDPACFRIEGTDTPRLLRRVFLAVGVACITVGLVAAAIVGGVFAR